MIGKFLAGIIELIFGRRKPGPIEPARSDVDEIDDRIDEKIKRLDKD